MGFESLYKLSVIMNLVDNMSGPIKKVGGSAQNSVSKLDGMSATFGNMTKTGALMAGAGVQIAEGLQKPVQATFETKKAISELSSLGVQDLEMMEDAAKNFSSTWAGTTKADFISAAYDIKSGIASLTDDGVAQFTDLAGMTATATKSSIGTMTNLFATGYGIYKDYYSDLSDQQFGELFSAGISQSVKQFKTTGDEMSSAIENLGASATNARVPLEEQLSVLGMLQSTMSGSEAGTKYTAFLRSTVKGGEELGLSFVDANNQMLSMPEILDKLHGKFGDTIDATEKLKLQEAFGDSESVKLIDLMYNKTGDLQSNIVGLYQTMGQGTDATRQMADAINSSDPSMFEIISQKAHNVSETIGNAVLPKVKEYGTTFDNVLTKVDTWVSGHQELVSNIFQVLAVIAGLLVVLGVANSTVGLIGGTVIKTITNVQKFGGACKTLWGGIQSGIPLIKSLGGEIISFARQAVASASAALGPLITSVWSFTAALLANPITWVVIGIVALIAGLALLYNKCETFRNIVNKLAATMKAGFGAALTIAKNVFEGIGNFAKKGMQATKDTVTEKLNNIKNAYIQNGGGIKGVAVAAIEGVKGCYTAGFTFLDKLTGGKLTEIKNKFSEKLAPVKEVVGSVMTAATDTVKEKLGNMKNAYEQNGGGIKGIAAAAIEGVKGYYTAGFTFIDNLTGGKLTAIKQKFTDGINNVKNTISNSITWFKNSGKKIMDTFTSGIMSAINKPVEAVKGGLQKIRNMLPFSDAKTGPLNKLTLSGTKVLSTLTTGIKQSENLPAEAVNQSFEKIDLSVKKKPGKVNLNVDQEESRGSEGKDKSESRKTVIEKLMLNVDLKTIKDLQQLLKLVNEIEDYTNSRNDDDGLQPV